MPLLNPESISTAQTADIIFKLYLYTRNTGITNYTSLAKVDLALNSNGRLDKNVTGLDENVTFTPTSIGTGSITATIENVAYTTTLTVTTDGTTFWDLNQTINNNTNDTITLDKNYTYNPASDSAFVNGIIINRSVTINGNGHTIDAKGKARIFYIEADNVEIENITFKNANSNGDGGAVYFAKSGRVINCNFTNNQVTGDISRGGAVYFSSNGNVTNCNFVNNTASKFDGGAVYFRESGMVINCNFTNNTGRYGGAISSVRGTVTNCYFTNNNAYNGAAVYLDKTGEVTNCYFTNNQATGDGGAIYFELPSTGEVINCNFVNNSASHGGAIWFYSGAVENCNFTNNSARYGGAIEFWEIGTVENCNFTNNNAYCGGAVYTEDAYVANCNFINNNASAGGAIFFNSNGNVTNCNFVGNNATNGSAINFDNWDSSDNLTISNSTFLNNKAKVDDNTPLNVTINGNNITITFMGRDNLLNAIYSANDGGVKFTNVTYWGAHGITNTNVSPPSRSNGEAGQNITIGVVVNDRLVLNEVKVTDDNGAIVLDISAGESYYIGVRHDEDSYYTEAETIISKNVKFYVNVTSVTTNNLTVNITAKSNMPNVIQGKLQFMNSNKSFNVFKNNF